MSFIVLLFWAFERIVGILEVKYHPCATGGGEDIPVETPARKKNFEPIIYRF